MTNNRGPEQLSPPGIKDISRRLLFKTARALTGAGVLEFAAKRLGIETPSLLIPEYVHAMEGKEEEIKNTAGNTLGRHFTQTGDNISMGFSVVDNGQGGLWTAFQR